ncbi:MAG TPA: LysE family translocator [Streptosporangiaceae bacterium]|jgi:threonine/homoserine/homoserine lactone efflux protein|nr:LysE family translocator [Streptosporangiaceae bacterium]
MNLSAVLAFWGVCLVLIIVPGADWAFVVSAGLRGRSVVPAVGGLVLGYTVLTAVVAAGVGTLVARDPVLLTVLTVAGGGYLIWRGAATLAAPAPAPDLSLASAARAAAPAPAGPTLARGLGVSGLNPKGLLLFLALLPQFTSRHGSWPLPGQLALLGVVFTLTCGAFYLGLGSVIRAVLLPRPGTARAITRLSGASMIGVGALLLAEHFLM